jgi:hypothetical protein
MKRLLHFVASASLAGCGNPPPDQAGGEVPNGRATVSPAFDRTVSEDRLAILCDPVRFRLSIRYKADRTSVDTSYPRRLTVDPESLVARFPNQGGEEQYQDSLIRYERCGPLVIRIEGSFLNSNIEGEMGAIAPFALVRVWADNRLLAPNDGRGAIRLAPCDESLPRWENCPADYAVRLDLAYQPELERVTSHEWVLSGHVLEEDYQLTERESSVQALLGRWMPKPR